MPFDIFQANAILLGAGPFYNLSLVSTLPGTDIPLNVVNHSPSQVIDGDLSTYWQYADTILDDAFRVDLGEIPNAAPLFYVYNTNFSLMDVATASAAGGPYTPFMTLRLEREARTGIRRAWFIGSIARYWSFFPTDVDFQNIDPPQSYLRWSHLAVAKPDNVYAFPFRHQLQYNAEVFRPIRENPFDTGARKPIYTGTRRRIRYTLDTQTFPSDTNELALFDVTVQTDGNTPIILVENLIAPTDYMTYILQDNPTIFFPLGEPSGTTEPEQQTAATKVQVVSDAKHTFLGSLTGTAVKGVVGPLSYDQRTAFVFTGSNYITVPDSNALDANLMSYSWEWWMKASPGATTQVLIGKYDTILGSNGFVAVLNGSTGIVSIAFNAQAATATKSILDGQWHHFVAVLARGTGIFLYLDGVQVAFTTYTDIVTNINNTHRLILGNGGTTSDLTGNPFTGNLAYVVGYQYQLGASRVAQRYNAAKLMPNLIDRSRAAQVQYASATHTSFGDFFQTTIDLEEQ